MKMGGRIADKVCVVTGAGSGIGRATAIRLAEEGGRVLCADIDFASATETARLAGTIGGVASALLNIERYDLGLDYFRRYPDMVRAIMPENVMTAVRKFLDPERLAIAIAGP